MAGGRDVYITPEELPVHSQTFLDTHFPGDGIRHVTKDRENFDVRLSSGAEVDFTLTGDWDKIEGNGVPMPQSVLDLLPKAIIDYITTKAPNAAITEISVELYGYEIELSNGLDIRFRSSGELISIDD